MRFRRRTFEQLATLTPPRRLLDQPGTGNWRDLGAKWLETFRMWGELQPDDDVLEIGCGSGRMALALSQYLSGRYEGFDVEAPAIEWCRKEIESRWPASSFRRVDVENTGYNPSGATGAASFTFPYDDESFDFVLATSVFTHMAQDDVSNYISEAARVLRPGGRFLASWFLVDASVWQAVNGGDARFTFSHTQGANSFIEDAAHPTAAVAYDETWAVERQEAAGLDVTVHRGAWSGSVTDGRHSQDVTVARRPGTGRRTSRTSRH